jgi:prepilin-type N-terminal cleavage/methylation domain-containing protein
MLNPLRFLLTPQYKQSQLAQKTGGFTLIELLVSMIIASIIIVSLLSFVIDILGTDRREQAKASSEQEIQAALDYIARDLQQATYIYDGTATGLVNIQDRLPPAAGTVAGCDVGSCQPVLVFWKREFLPDAFPTTGGDDDAFVYSLVAYYHIKDSACQPTSNWSCTSRIGRFQIKDAVRGLDPNAPPPVAADPGFAPPPVRNNTPTLTPQTPQQVMNSWTKDPNTDYADNPGVLTLIDYIDQSDLTNAASSVPPLPTCPGVVDQNGIPLNPLVGGAFNTSSFYACVDATKTTAQVFIRGNALARINPRTNPPSYNSNASVYFPSAKMQIRGRGTFGGT